jgi:hypothetical protein
VISTRLVSNVSTAASVFLCTVPSGPCTVILSNNNASTLYVSAASSFAGTAPIFAFPVAASTPSITLPMPVLSEPVSLYGSASAGTANTIGVMILGQG